MDPVEHKPGPRPCPVCKDSPVRGEVFDRDGAGGHYTECSACYGTGEVGFKPTLRQDEIHRAFAERKKAPDEPDRKKAPDEPDRKKAPDEPDPEPEEAA
jgi:hypothetical protein